MVVIQERRLHVGVHNGWCFLDKPQVVVLEPLASGASGRADSTSKQGTLVKDRWAQETHAYVCRGAVTIGYRRWWSIILLSDKIHRCAKIFSGVSIFMVFHQPLPALVFCWKASGWKFILKSQQKLNFLKRLSLCEFHLCIILVWRCLGKVKHAAVSYSSLVSICFILSYFPRATAYIWCVAHSAFLITCSGSKAVISYTPVSFFLFCHMKEQQRHSSFLPYGWLFDCWI